MMIAAKSEIIRLLPADFRLTGHAMADEDKARLKKCIPVFETLTGSPSVKVSSCEIRRIRRAIEVKRRPFRILFSANEERKYFMGVSPGNNEKPIEKRDIIVDIDVFTGQAAL